MNKLFTPAKIAALELRNRLVRSATAEKMADENGFPRPELYAFYKELACGGVGLIISGHMYIHPSGKCHLEMCGIHRDELVPSMAKLAEVSHQAGAKVVVQINHGGMQCSRESVQGTLAPSDLNMERLTQPARAMSTEEVWEMIKAYGQAARRVKEAGFDGVQLHGAHGYLISQFLSPYTNQRQDRWGGSPDKRRQFLRDVVKEVRSQIGPDFLLLIKLGLADGVEGGMSLDEGLETVSELENIGINALEISGGIGGGEVSNVLAGVKVGKNEAYFLDWAVKARQVTSLPILLVGGFRSCEKMETVLKSGSADFISMCRPLICEPDLPRRLEQGLQKRSICISGNRCFPESTGLGVACRCPVNRDLRENQ